MTEHGDRRSVGVGHDETVTDSAIADWGERSVSYRGYDVLDLVRESTFTEVVYLLLCGDLPEEIFLADFRAVLAAASDGEEWSDESAWMT